MSNGGCQGSKVSQAQQIWAMLDDMALNDPSGYKRFIEEQMKQGRELMPQPKICIQTSITKPKKGRLYINFFHWSRVPKPKSDEDPIPVIGGLPIWGVHSSDDNILSVAFNEDVTKLLEKPDQNQERDALINLAIDFLCDHHSTRISRNYTIVQGKQHHGDLKALQKGFGCKETPDKKDLKDLLGENLNDVKIPGLSSFLSNDSCNTAKDTPVENPAEHLKFTKNNEEKNCKKPLIEEILTTPAYSCAESVVKDGDICDAYTISLPSVTSVAQCHLDISHESIQLLVSDLYSITIPLPENSDETRATAKFIKKSSNLVVLVPRKQS